MCIGVVASHLAVCIIHTMTQEVDAMRSRDVIELIQADGWYEVAAKGSHHQFKHPTKPGRVTIAHPCSEVPRGTLNNILKQAGLK